MGCGSNKRYQMPILKAREKVGLELGSWEGQKMEGLFGRVTGRIC
jgi:hypothetical protein